MGGAASVRTWWMPSTSPKTSTMQGILDAQLQTSTNPGEKLVWNWRWLAMGVVSKRLQSWSSELSLDYGSFLCRCSTPSLLARVLNAARSGEQRQILHICVCTHHTLNSSSSANVNTQHSFRVDPTSSDCQHVRNTLSWSEFSSSPLVKGGLSIHVSHPSARVSYQSRRTVCVYR